MRSASLGSALLVTLAVWTVLVSGSRLSSLVGDEAAILLVFSLAAAILIATRPPSAVRFRRCDVALIGLFVTLGFAVHPLLCALTAVVGLAVGIDPTLATASGAGGLPLLIAVVVIAPVFEELLYRERLLDAIAATPLGGSGATLLTSVLFAVPHLAPLQMLGCFLVGVLLALVRRVSRKITACIGLHAGLNLRSVWEFAGGAVHG
jgi:membrane protease YdiL (CAAX protease family)